jgi:hypothetical protein
MRPKGKSCIYCGCRITHEYFFDKVGPICYDCCVEQEKIKDHTSYLFDEKEED